MQLNGDHKWWQQRIGAEQRAMHKYMDDPNSQKSKNGPAKYPDLVN
jgi:hypothetical protein